MKLEQNTNIKTDKGTKVFCHEDYAQDLYDAYMGNGMLDKKITKDIEKHDLLEITDVTSVKSDEIEFEVNNVSNFTINLLKEKRFLDIFKLSEEEFVTWLVSDNGADFVNQKHKIFVESSKPVVKGSLFLGHVVKQQEEFLKQISNPTTAYVAKIKNKNQGGFLVDVLGVEAFLPGSLAAANKITNFDSYIGKEIPVMIEDYLNDIKTFIVSNKKYIKHVLPKKAKEIDFKIKHTGQITGTTKFGIFVEFYDIFTGLLHTSKMSDETKEMFENNSFKPGDSIECYVREIGKNYRLILTDFSPEETKVIEEKEKEKKSDGTTVGDVFEGVLISKKHFGAFVRIPITEKTNQVGLLPKSSIPEEWDKEPGDKIKVKISSKKENKIFFTLNEE